MNKFLSVILVLLALCLSSTAFAYTPPVPTGYVTDTTGKLSAASKKSLNAKITNYNRATSNEIGVLVIPTIGDENISDVTHDTFKTWKLGKSGLDNGVLIVIALESRKLRIQTGKGVEGDLPDIVTSDIINLMKPALKTNDVATALNVAVDNIIAKLDSRKGQKADDAGVGVQFNKPLPAPVATTTANTSSTSSTSSGCSTHSAGFPIGGFMFVFAIFALIAIFLVVRSKKRNDAKLRELLKEKEDQLAASVREAAARARVSREVAKETQTRNSQLNHTITSTSYHQKVTPTTISNSEAQSRRERDLQREREQKARRYEEERQARARREEQAELQRQEAKREEESRSYNSYTSGGTFITYSNDDDSSSGSSSGGSDWSGGGSDSSDSGDSGYGGGDSGGGGSDSDF